jgi:hypothetical protein
MGAVLVLWPAGLLVAASAIPSSSCGQCGRDASDWRCRAALDARGEVLFCLVQTAVGRRDELRSWSEGSRCARTLCWAGACAVPCVACVLGGRPVEKVACRTRLRARILIAFMESSSHQTRYFFSHRTTRARGVCYPGDPQRPGPHSLVRGRGRGLRSPAIPLTGL